MDGDDAEAFKHRQRQLWSVGDHEAIAAQYRLAAEDLIERLDVGPGTTVLDIGTGVGSAAIAAARVGARAVGLDLTPELFDDAEARAAELGVEVEWREGDAESLPYADGSFDVVVSTFGLMFAPRPEVAAAEVVRVLRPGGRFGVANWALRGAVLAVFEALGGGSLPAPSPTGSPLRWGDPDEVRDLFGRAHAEVDCAWSAVEWVFPSAEDGVRWLEEVSGPVIAAKAALQQQGLWSERRAQLVRRVAAMTRDDLDGVWISADYLIALGTVVNGGATELSGR